MRKLKQRYWVIYQGRVSIISFTFELRESGTRGCLPNNTIMCSTVSRQLVCGRHLEQSAPEQWVPTWKTFCIKLWVSGTLLFVTGQHSWVMLAVRNLRLDGSVEKRAAQLKAYMGFPSASDSRELACSAGDLGLIPRSGRSPGEGNGYPLQYSCLENPMDREPGGLQSMGSQRVGHNWSVLARTHNAYIFLRVYLFLLCISFLTNSSN